MWGIASDDDPEDLRRYADALGLSFPILLDEAGMVHNQYAIASAFPSAAYPQDWIVGPDGRIAYSNNAFEPDEIRLVLDLLLEGSSP